MSPTPVLKICQAEYKILPLFLGDFRDLFSSWSSFHRAKCIKSTLIVNKNSFHINLWSSQMVSNIIFLFQMTFMLYNHCFCSKWYIIKILPLLLFNLKILKNSASLKGHNLESNWYLDLLFSSLIQKSIWDNQKWLNLMKGKHQILANVRCLAHCGPWLSTLIQLTSSARNTHMNDTHRQSTMKRTAFVRHYITNDHATMTSDMA